MATITLRYNTDNIMAMSILDSIRETGVFEILESSENYDAEFVKKIQESEKQFAEGKSRKIETADLWK
ncbi:MAG: hypothetical protein LBE91_19145 [Tannerella sp.]|jgi:hypothetical protein|nr:hypothetical protein [Tannerella sp.]